MVNDPRLSVESVIKGERNLVIRDVKTSDRSNYTCELEGDGFASKFFHLNVIGKISIHEIANIELKSKCSQALCSSFSGELNISSDLIVY